MKTYPTNKIRNVVLLGHGGSGKTSIVEAMAYNVDIIDRMGKIEDGNTISDYNQEEIKRGISISSSIVPIELDGHKLNIMDVPGYFDFSGETFSALRVADSAVIVIDALAGLEVGAQKAWEYVKERKIPSIIVVNKMDRENVRFNVVMENLKNQLGNKVVPFEMPYGEALDFKGVLNVVDMTGRERLGDKCIDIELPEELKDDITPYREMIIESVAQSTEELMEKFFNGEEISNDEIHKGLRKGVLEGDLIPVLCTSGVNNIGIETLANMIIEFFPAPDEKKVVVGKDVKSDKIIERKISAQEPLSVFVFKTIVDPYVGRLSQFRIMSGTLQSGQELLNSKKDKKEKINHIYVLRGKKQIEVEKLEAGDIGAFSKLSDTFTGDTLCDIKNPIVYDDIEFPKPIISMAIQPKTKGDEDKIGHGLQRLQEEDPTLKVERNHETKQTLISGMGEMHIEVLHDKLQSKFGVEVELIDPQIPYRETIKSKASSEGKHKKQSGGRGQYGHVYIDFEPIGETDQGFLFVDKVVGGSVPRNFIPAVEKGLADCTKEGVLAGFPVVGIKATLTDGSYHAVDSDEMSFKMAASLAYRKGMKNANPVLLEPVYKIEINVPENFMGDILGDLNKKRGRIIGMEQGKGESQKIIAEAPLSEMFKYATELRSMTHAKGEFSMEFVRYEEVPSILAEKVIEETNNKK
ncbi:elongation factor G [Alkalibaculum sp. M08DMB]|uniref:Elongation factor G n=1 Tax=Alkalibaculum sporogenes TaxID=2655001 RepID=A0A6A7KA05_9FIRM|nr:elongation factor G [Alkalibaculum sporogenes]MPW26195.1 elongation factor G [Alkalibaculum sporogenes]